MSLLFYPLAAMVGALAGALIHETAHAVAAIALGELVGFGWQGGLAGGPYVDFRAESRWRSEVIRKAPLAFGVVTAALVALAFDGPSLWWVASAAAAAGLLWTSPEDLFADAAERSASG